MTPLAWLGHLTEGDLAAQPMLALQQFARPLAWGLVLACLLVALARWLAGRRGGRLRPQAVLLLLALALAAAFLPGGLSPAFWLGLAFQQPSLVASGLCAWYLLRSVRPAVQAEEVGPWRAAAALAVLAGWALLLDTFALLPWSLYAWGWQPVAVLLMVLLALLPWLLGQARRAPVLTYGLPLVLLTYAALRLPTGNVWDALLDPWLWLAAHLALLPRRAWGRRR